MNAPARPIVLCFGEILWDFLPAGLFAGGAPFNVGYHAQQLGLDARVVSAVRRDVLGEELLRRLRGWGMATDLITQHKLLPTGVVRATIGPAGDAHYDIAGNVAWDRIPIPPAAAEVASRARALVYGSLAQRSRYNRDSLTRLLELLPGDALRVFDVNLRSPFDDLPLVRTLAKRATLLKLNAVEAARLAAGAGESPGEEEKHARALAAESGCAIVCITAGARGAGLLRDGHWSWEPGQPVATADTVGAGDAFLAALVTGLLQKRVAPPELLAGACRLGEWVATQRGATPSYANAPVLWS